MSGEVDLSIDLNFKKLQLSYFSKVNINMEKKF